MHNFLRCKCTRLLWEMVEEGGVAGLRLGSNASDVLVAVVTLTVTRLFDPPLQQRWQEGRLPQSSLTQQREIRPPLQGRKEQSTVLFFYTDSLNSFKKCETQTRNHQSYTNWFCWMLHRMRSNKWLRGINIDNYGVLCFVVFWLQVVLHPTPNSPKQSELHKMTVTKACPDQDLKIKLAIRMDKPQNMKHCG